MQYTVGGLPQYKDSYQSHYALIAHLSDESGDEGRDSLCCHVGGGVKQRPTEAESETPKSRPIPQRESRGVQPAQ